MRFPLPLSLHLARFPILHFLLFPSYLPLPFLIVRRSRYREFCFSSLVADYSFFASRIFSVFPAFHARLFAWVRYDLISRRSFLNDSTKF
ncbi:hypothetical protein N7489_001411 [Penicillium chrysogenum]|uniref:Secreted protein n=1 Tax=Penicillium chrysogenum TaxID=5076 RepID=A0ABQ8WII6_PENCH|nr:uncharacterized protein N7489_001411 [Penicillium chrysogenum]KAJ5852849.1 hypothetical protein N7534_005392 [Penicillium rubens]KAJ5251001.1 hypothetical protein N7489_001411 [Penicillium chrysogenum]KAJ5262439.1 hypothetical protein N7524_007744 [Penicillium chrysogenum]KAJ5269900.1 hypothetical protein N7505_005658 [Penicillium chrysogenum]KAJ6147366.1 hypothetical protein N7497_009348 [Penicillium chrysogenum]